MISALNVGLILNPVLRLEAYDDGESYDILRYVFSYFLCI